MKKKKKPSKKSINAEIAQQLDQIEIDRKRALEDSKDNIDKDDFGELVKDKSVIEDFETQLTDNEPIRELFTSKNIKFKTEITEEQRGTLSILYAAYEHAKQIGLSLNVLKNILDQYVDFGVALKRKGRQEYVEAHKSQMFQQAMQNKFGNSPETDLKS